MSLLSKVLLGRKGIQNLDVGLGKFQWKRLSPLGISRACSRYRSVRLLGATRPAAKLPPLVPPPKAVACASLSPLPPPWGPLTRPASSHPTSTSVPS